MTDLFPGFSERHLDTGAGPVHVRVGGSGPPVLLLHGYPQTLAIWHRMAPQLAAEFTVIAADLRGYGGSGKPPTTDDHAPYSKRAMAQDLVAAMELLGFRSFQLVGHDRGGRVGHRLAVDHPDRVRSLTILDIAPTLAMYERTDMEFARAYYHWFFLIQPAPLPERLIGADPEFFLRAKLRGWSQGRWPFDDAAFEEYLRCFRPLDEWRRVADDVSGRPLPSGHFLPEEVPDDVLRELLPFLRRLSDRSCHPGAERSRS